MCGSSIYYYYVSIHLQYVLPEVSQCRRLWLCSSRRIPVNDLLLPVV